MSSAVYIPVTAKDTRHHGLNAEVYTHASSPLRRYADLHNQRIFKEIYHAKQYRPEDTELLETLNQKAKDAKKYERDYGFLQAIFDTSTNVISGKVIGLKQKNSIVRIEMWIPAWKRMADGAPHREDSNATAGAGRDPALVARQEAIERVFVEAVAEPDGARIALVERSELDDAAKREVIDLLRFHVAEAITPNPPAFEIAATRLRSDTQLIAPHKIAVSQPRKSVPRCIRAAVLG
jgi:hypothetical protein